MKHSVYLLDTVKMDTTAIILVNVLTHRYAVLRFEAVEDGCGGYSVNVSHMNQEGVDLEVIEKLTADVALIKDAIGETVRVKIWGKKE